MTVPARCIACSTRISNRWRATRAHNSKDSFRTMEKMLMKPSDDASLGRSDNVCGIVRCMLVYENIADLHAGLRAINLSVN